VSGVDGDMAKVHQRILLRHPMTMKGVDAVNANEKIPEDRGIVLGA